MKIPRFFRGSQGSVCPSPRVDDEDEDEDDGDEDEDEDDDRDHLDDVLGDDDDDDDEIRTHRTSAPWTRILKAACDIPLPSCVCFIST
jgi:hypothetical protein